MSRRLLLTAFSGLGLLTLSACDFGGSSAKFSPNGGSAANGTAGASVEIGEPLYASVKATAPAAAPVADAGVDPIIVPDLQVSVIAKEDIPSQRDGVVEFIGVPVKEEEVQKPKPGREYRQITTIDKDNKENTLWYKELREGDVVGKDQTVAIIDNKLALADYRIKDSKVTAAVADADATSKTKAEAHERWMTQQRLWGNGGKIGVTTAEELRGAKLVYEKSHFEDISKHSAVEVAKREKEQSRTVLEMHEIKSSIDGVVKTIYKKKGESIKNLDPVIQVQNTKRVWAEGQIPLQQLAAYRQKAARFGGKDKWTAYLETCPVQDQDRVLEGHLQEVTAVAVAKPAGPDDKNPLVCSGSEDGTVRVWDRATKLETTRFHPKTVGAVRALTCSPQGAKENLCVAGTAEGGVWVWDLDGKGTEAVRKFPGKHRGAVRAIAFSPKGDYFATGGEDGMIYVWETAGNSDKELYAFPDGHRTAVTSLQFTDQCQLISAGRDNTVRIWTLGKKGAREEKSFANRSGDVEQLGARQDGQGALFERQKTLAVLSVPDGRVLGTLTNRGTKATNFSTLAEFSHKGDLIVTAGLGEGRLQLWRSPDPANHRGREIREFASEDHSPVTSVAFSPDDSFLVAGTRNGKVLIWSVPTAEEIQRSEIKVDDLYSDTAVEPAAGQAHIRAEVDNPDMGGGKEKMLDPGTTVNLVIKPN